MYMKKTCLILLFSVNCIITLCAQNHHIDRCHCDSCLDIKIGRMIMAGFKGVTPSEEIEDAIRQYHIGGVILFDRDASNDMGERNIRSPRQLKELTAQLRSMSPVPLLIAIDQEGGLINRLKPTYGFPATVTAAYQGTTGSLDSASFYAAATASTLAQYGINVNFVPCVDVNVNAQNPIIARYGRSFSSDPDSVYMFADRWVQEHHKRNIATSLKHFPGHGSSHDDSHLGLTDITDTWDEQELIPYRRFVEGGYNGIVMVGHLFNNKIDSLYPASLSWKTLQGMLRDDIGFEGAIATDDMNMGAIVNNYSFRKALSLAVNAGVNLIIIGNNAAEYEEGLAQRCHGMIKSMVLSGEIDPAKIDDSYARIESLISTIGIK